MASDLKFVVLTEVVDPTDLHAFILYNGNEQELEVLKADIDSLNRAPGPEIFTLDLNVLFDEKTVDAICKMYPIDNFVYNSRLRWKENRDKMLTELVKTEACRRIINRDVRDICSFMHPYRPAENPEYLAFGHDDEKMFFQLSNNECELLTFYRDLCRYNICHAMDFTKTYSEVEVHDLVSKMDDKWKEKPVIFYGKFTYSSFLEDFASAHRVEFLESLIRQFHHTGMTTFYSPFFDLDH